MLEILIHRSYEIGSQSEDGKDYKNGFKYI